MRGLAILDMGAVVIELAGERHCPLLLILYFISGCTPSVPWFRILSSACVPMLLIIHGTTAKCSSREEDIPDAAYDTPQIQHTGIRNDTPGKFDTLPHSGRCVENALGYH
jgi:hypothetical protein